MEEPSTVYAVSQNDAEETQASTAASGCVSHPFRSRRRELPASNADDISSVPTMILVETDGTISRAPHASFAEEPLSLGGIAGAVPLPRRGECTGWKAG